MDTDDDRNSTILELRRKRDRLEDTYKNAGASLPDKGDNIRQRIVQLEELIHQKRLERAKVPPKATKHYPPTPLSHQRKTYLSRPMPGSIFSRNDEAEGGLCGSIVME